MHCLDDVINFFVRQAGPGTRPIATNDLSKLGVATIVRPGTEIYNELHLYLSLTQT